MRNNLIGLLISFLFVPGAFAQGLFQGSNNSTSTDEQLNHLLNSMTIRSRQAVMDRGQLFPSLPADNSLTLNLFADAEFKAEIKNSRSLPAGGSFMSGSLENGGRMTLFISKEGIVRGEVHSPRGVYTIKSSKDRNGSNNNIVIRQLDTSTLPPVDHGAVDIRTRNFERAQEGRSNQSKPSSALESGAAYFTRGTGVADARRVHNNMSKDGLQGVQQGLATGAQETELPPDEIVDILIVYTPGAQASQGGKAEVEATIAAEVEKTNQALENSGLEHRKIRLVAMEKVNYTEAEDIGYDLQYLASRKGDWYDDDPTGIMDEVHELRDQYAADMIHLFVTEPRGACGLAKRYQLDTRRVMERICIGDDSPDVDMCADQRDREERLRGVLSASAISEGCTLGNAFAHELGHNFGIFHDRYLAKRASLSLTDPVSFPIRPYAFGYVNQNFNRSKCSYTIVATRVQCEDEGYSSYAETVRELMFSNPDLELGSEELGFDPAGVPGEEQTVALDGPVNAARAIDDMWDTIANLYHSSTSCSGRFFSSVPDSVRISSAGDTKTYTISSKDGPDFCSADDLDLTAESDGSFINTSVESRTVTDDDGNESGEYDIALTVRANSTCRSRTGSASFSGGAGISQDVSIIQRGARLCGLINGASSTGSSPESLASLNFSGENVDHVGGFLFGDLTGLESLNLSNNEIRALPANAFTRATELEGFDDSLSRRDQIHLISNNQSIAGLVNLKDLDLSRNLIERLSALAFSNLFKLRRLDLSENRLRGLPRGVFSDLLELEELSLSGNEIRGLRADLLANTGNLEELNASENEIRSLSADVFDNVSELKELDLSGNAIAKLPTNVFSNLAELEYLWLHNNNLSNITANAFARLTSLRGLSLDGNAVGALSANAFASATGLEYLWLSADEVTRLSGNVFSAPTQLKYLSLSANGVPSLPGNVFSRLAELRYLNLSVNEVRTLPAGLFSGLPNLRYLRLSGDSITSLPASVCSFVGNVRYAGVSGFELSRVCPSSGTGVSMASVVSGLMDVAGDGFGDDGSSGVGRSGAGSSGAGFRGRSASFRPYNRNVIMKMHEDNLDFSGISSLTGYDESAVSYGIRAE